ncbi:MAG: FAD-dependent oxidoreductase [Clostridia bacterium]|nr:FAD-dependent oxidoreductase [Clostridia bacterium]
MSPFPIVTLKTDFCVVGGGLSGLSAAVAAARRGTGVVLVQDRPMLGGNASSEVRMWICGAHGENMRETGIVEELELENQHRNPYKNYSIWDSVMLEIVKKEPNITLLLNTTCTDGRMEGNKLREISCWQMTTQKIFRIEAKLFADCSGDSVLAPVTGAPFRMGREGRSEYGESIAPEQADARTMGMSTMIVAREYPGERKFVAPSWARKVTKEDLKLRTPDMRNPGENFWYLELGGMRDAIGDTEEVRDELLKLAYGIWDYLKNDPEERDKNRNFDIDWIGILPGKRESRRYIGDYVMTQHDVSSGGRFDDIVAYGGWTMDDHHPGGFDAKDEPPTIFHPAPSPYGIPYRSLYSKTVENLFFAGRNISVTHTAMSSTRVMATCALLGQAVGNAAAIASREGLSPREVGKKRIRLLQENLMDDDCYLPGLRRRVSPLAMESRLESDMENAEAVRNGVDRPVGGAGNAAKGKAGSFLRYLLPAGREAGSVRLVFDSDLDRKTLPGEEAKLRRPMFHNLLLHREASYTPKTLVRDFDLIYKTAEGEKTLAVRGNYQRLVRVSLPGKASEVTLRILATHGEETARVFAFDVIEAE